MGLIALLNLLSGLVAFLISYYAYKNNKLVGSILLQYISAGFLLLGASLVLQAGTERIAGVTPVEAFRAPGIEFAIFLVYTTFQVVAYGVFAWGYGLSAFVRKQAPAGAVPSLMLANPGKLLSAAVLTVAISIVSQIAVIVLLLMIVAQGMRIYSHSKSNLALMVLFGFALIFGGHLLMLSGVLATSGTVFLVGTTIEFCGFLGLLFFLVWSSRVVK